MRTILSFLCLFSLLASCKDYDAPIIDGIYDHPRDEDTYEVPDNATPIDFYTMPTTRVENLK